MAVLAFRRVLELRNRGKTIFEQRLKDVKEKVTNDFRWIREKAFQGMGGRDYESQTDLAGCIEDVARGILRKLGLPTETEANLDLDVDELPGDPVDLFWAIWDEATGMMIRGLAASPCCARRILHLARAVEQWHGAAGINQLRRVALGSETGSSTEMTEQGPTQVTDEAFGTWTGVGIGIGGTRLHLAAQEGDVLGLKPLLTPDTNINCRDFSGKTPLHSLVSSPRCSLEAVGFLLHHGADVAARDKHEETPLHLAARWGQKEVVDLLIQCGADISARNKYNETSLHRTALFGHKEVVGLLIQRGADVSARDKFNKTPLHVAASMGHKEVVYLLIQCGADVAARHEYNRTPLHVAAMRGHKEVVDLLIQRGAHVAARDKHSRTPLYLAVQRGHKQVVDLLVQRGAGR